MSKPDLHDAAAVFALTALAEHGIPPDVQELLVFGNPAHGIKPGALSKAVKAVMLAMRQCETCEGRGYLVADAEWEPYAIQCQDCKDRRAGLPPAAQR